MSVPVVDVRRPPARWRFGFFVLGLRLPAEYGPWVADQCATYGRVRVVMAFRYLNLLPAIVLFAVVLSSPAFAWGAASGLLAGLVISQVTVVRSRQQLLEHQGVDGLGRPVPLRGLSRLGNLAMWSATVAALALVLVVVSRLG